MPTYDYQCDKCEHHFEEILKISEREEPLKNPCPNCKAEESIQLCMTAPFIGDPVRQGVTKMDGKLKERLQEIKRKHPRANGIKL